MSVSKTDRNRQKAPAVARYQAKAYRKYTFRVRTDGTAGFSPSDLENAAEAAGMSVNAWIIQAIKDKL